MRNYMKRWMAYLFVAFLVFGAFPLLSGSTGAEAGDRAGEISIDDIGIVGPAMSQDDSFEIGVWNVTIQFDAAQEMELNVTVNVTIAGNDTFDEQHTANIPYVAQGDNQTIITSWSFNFTNLTATKFAYWVNVTLDDNDSAFIDTMNKKFKFEDITDLIIEPEGIAFEGVESGGFYSNETLDINATITNNGNKVITDNITVDFTVLNATNVTVNTGQVIIKGGLAVGGDAHAAYTWTPPLQGLYYVNLTWNCSEVDANAVKDLDENVALMIQNVTSYFATLGIEDPTLDEGEPLQLWFVINNTGNVEHNFWYTINVSKVGLDIPGEYKDTGNVTPHAENNVTGYSLPMTEEGVYTAKVTFDLGGFVDKTFTVAAIYGMVDGKVTDSATGANISGASVIILNATNVTILPTELTDDNGSYSKINLLFGTYTIYVNVSGYDNSSIETFTLSDLDQEEVVNFALDAWVPSVVYHAPTLTDGTGVLAATDNDDVMFKVLFTDADNDTGAVKVRIDTFNMTANESKNWTWENGTWMTMEFNATGLTFVDGVNYTYTKKFAVGSYRYHFMVTDAVKGDVTSALVEFNVTKYVEPDVTGELGGYILESATGPVIVGAKIVVETYTWGIEVQNISNVSTNVSVQVPDVSQPNVTSNATGYFMLEGIGPGKWNVTVTADGYETKTVELTFTTALKEMNFTLTKTIVKYDITGTVDPADATITFTGTEAVTVNTTTGAFSVAGLLDGSYNLTFAKTGYTPQTKTVVINGSAPAALTVILVIEDPQVFNVTIGPILDEDDKPVELAIIELDYNGWPYFGTTDADGNAIIVGFPLDAIPVGTNITLTTLDGEEYIWAQGDPLPVPPGKASEDPSSLLWLWILIIVVVIILILVVILMKKKKPEEAPIDLEEDEMEEGIGEDFDEDMEDLEEDDGFDEFEPEPSDDEMEGVEDFEEELEEFDEDEDLGFEDEEFGEYEDDLDDEFDDDLDEDLDEDFDEEFDDDEFDDDDDF